MDDTAPLSAVESGAVLIKINILLFVNDYDSSDDNDDHGTHNNGDRKNN